MLCSLSTLHRYFGIPYNIQALEIKNFLILILLATSISLPISSHANTLSINASQVPPYHTSDLKGFEDQLLKEIYRRLGYEVMIHDVPPARALILVNDRIDDGSLARNPNMQKNFPNLVQFYEHALEREYVVFTKLPEIKINGWESLANHSVGIVLGWRILERNITKSKDLIKVRNGRLLFKLLENDRVDTVVFNKWGGLQLVRELGLKDVRLAQPSLASKKVYFYLNDRHAELAKDASEILREMKQDGTYERLFQEILSPLIQ